MADREDGEQAERRWWVRLGLGFFNPQLKAMVWAGLVPDLVLVETRGWRSGEPRRHVIGMQVDGDTGWAICRQGQNAGHLRDIAADPHVRVRVARRWRDAHAEALDHDDPRARVDAFGHRYAAAIRSVGITGLLTVRFYFS